MRHPRSDTDMALFPIEATTAAIVTHRGQSRRDGALDTLSPSAPTRGGPIVASFPVYS